MPVSTHGALLGGRYRVRRPLGLGGMAQVLLCQDEHLGRLVAVKRLHADSPEDVERRFAREARLGAALNHPNLVAVFDTAVDENDVLIVMEYVEGEPLSRALRDGPLDAGRVVRMARDVGAALDHAHAHDIVHRDVKPGNVLLRSDGIAKLADLGIATAVDLTRITRSGELLGTAAYMAPEQLEGREPRPASDVYALAAVCFEALTGGRPRQGSNAFELAHRIATEPPPDLREHLPSAPAAAAQALERGMARDPGERTASAGEFASELASAFGGGGADAQTVDLGAAAPTRELAPPPQVDRPRPPARPPAAAARPSRPAPAVVASSSSAPPPRRPASRAAPVRKASSGRRGPLALIPIALLLLAAAAAAAVLVSSGGDDSGGDPSTPSQQAGDAPARGQAKQGKADKAKPAKPEKAKSKGQAETTPAEPAAQPEPPATTPIDPARGAQLNGQGYALMQRGDYSGAIPVLQQAVASWPDDSTALEYAYALFNLGKSLNRAGRPSEAIPLLEKRLAWDDQRATVEAELALARRNAAGG